MICCDLPDTLRVRRVKKVRGVVKVMRVRRSTTGFCSSVFPSSPASFPEVAQIPDGFVLQLRAKQRVGLGQDGY